MRKFLFLMLMAVSVNAQNNDTFVKQRSYNLNNTPGGTPTVVITPWVVSGPNGNQVVAVPPTNTLTPTPTITPTFNAALKTASPTPFTPTLTPYVKGGRVIVTGDNPTPFNLQMVNPTYTPSFIPTPVVFPAQSPGMVYKAELMANNVSGIAGVTLTVGTPLATKYYAFGIGDIRMLPLLWMGGPVTLTVNGSSPSLNINGDIAIVPKNP